MTSQTPEVVPVAELGELEPVLRKAPEPRDPKSPRLGSHRRPRGLQDRGRERERRETRRPGPELASSCALHLPPKRMSHPGVRHQHRPDEATGAPEPASDAKESGGSEPGRSETTPPPGKARSDR